MGPTKTGKDRRVGLPPVVLEQLKDFRRNAEPHSEESFIFSRDGKHLNPEVFTKKVAIPLLKKATGGRIKRFHSLRHFLVSMLIDQGESPKYIEEQVGHASIRMTMDTCGHLMPHSRKEASEKLEKAMFGKAEEPIVRTVLEHGPSNAESSAVN